MTDATTAFLRALRDHAGTDFLLSEVRSRSWKSVTFAGARHEASFSIESDDADRCADRLLTAFTRGEPQLTGHFLADFRVVSDVRRPGVALLKVEALTVEDQA
jgi:hypothetical protein